MLYLSSLFNRNSRRTLEVITLEVITIIPILDLRNLALKSWSINSSRLLTKCWSQDLCPSQLWFINKMWFCSHWQGICLFFRFLQRFFKLQHIIIELKLKLSFQNVKLNMFSDMNLYVYLNIQQRGLKTASKGQTTP